MPGTSVDEAVTTVAGELPELPYLPELPERGVGADPVGRTVSLLVDIAAEVVSSGWRIARRPGVDHRRAADQRQRELDAAEQHFAGADWIKIQLLGPWSLAAGLEMPSGNLALTDAGAVDDLTASLSEGLVAHLAELRTRVAGAEIVVQFDEPRLAAVLAGALPTASGFGTVRAVEAARVRDLLARVVAAVSTATVVRPGDRPPMRLLRAAGFDGVAVDLTALGSAAADLDPFGEAVEDGMVLLAGIIPTAPTPDITLRERAAPLLEVWRRWGFPLSRLPGAVVPTPVDGLADVTTAQAVTAMRLSREIARALPDPPDDW